MSSVKTTLDDWTASVRFPIVNWDALESCVRPLTIDEKVHGLNHDWDLLTPAVRRVSEFEDLTGHTGVFTEAQHDNDTRVVDDSVTRDVARAMEDGHDFSDCGGDE